MPNKNYKEQLTLKEFHPSNWKNMKKRDTDELNWKFEYMLMNDSKRRILMKNFNPNHWMNLNTDEKVEICQKLENNLSLESHRYPYKIDPIENLRQGSTQVNGYTDPANGTIAVNVNKNPYTVIETVVHESCHADQYDMMLKKKYVELKNMSMTKYKKDLECNGLTENDALVIKWENYNYISDVENKKIMYDMQISEVEAVFESAKFFNKYSGYLESNEDLTQFIKKTEKELETIQSYFKNEELVKEWFEDRRERVKNLDTEIFSKKECKRLKAIFSSRDIKDCGFNILKDLENWSFHKQTEVESVGLDKLLENETRKSRKHTKCTAKKTVGREKSSLC